MVQTQNILLIGSSSATEQARALIENLPQVRQVQTGSKSGELMLMLAARLTEFDLTPLLAQSGISGFRIL